MLNRYPRRLFHLELYLPVQMKMNHCLSSDVFDDFSQGSYFNSTFHSEYHQIWQEVFKDSKRNKKTLHLDEIENMLIRLFPILIKKQLYKRSSEGLDSMDMPVVFMPQKSGADCVSKPKVKIYASHFFVASHRFKIILKSI